MKKCIMTFGLLALAFTAKAETGFLETLLAEDFATAGLQKLTPAELTRLETLVERYKAGQVAAVRQQAEATRQEAEKKIAAAETEARAAVARANQAAQNAGESGTQSAAAPARKQPGWFAALLTLSRASAKPEKEQPLVDRLAGDFNGWSGHTVFILENGTQWVQQNQNEIYVYSPVIHFPTVKITPAVISGFWLEINGVNRSVRVIPLHLSDQK